MSTNNSPPNVICLQEIWQIQQNTSFKLDGYHELIYKTRANCVQGGGVGIYIKDGTKFCILHNLSVFHDRVLESLFVEITTKTNDKFIVGSVYRPGNNPTLSVNEQYDMFSDLLANLLDTITEHNYSAFIFGDFNLNVLDYGICNRVTSYIDLLYSHGFIQTITLPTRCSGDSATAIDHCLTNAITNQHKSVILTSSISDHFPILYNISKNPIPLRPKYIETRDFSHTNISKFRDSISTINWEYLYSLRDPQCAYDYFLETFMSLYEIYFPLIKKRFNLNFHRADPWFTGGLLISRREKIRLDHKATVSKDPSCIAKYKTYRNIYNKTVRLAKKLYFESKIQSNQGNLKKIWRLLRCAINKKDKKSKNIISSLIYNNVTYSDPVSIANVLNLYFCSEPLSIINEIPPYNGELDLGASAPFCGEVPKFRSSDLQVSHEEINDALSKLDSKNSTDYNNLSMHFIKSCFSSISSPFKYIIDLSFSTGTIPSQLKIAKVVPIFKNGDPRLPNNYRPISLLSNMLWQYFVICARHLILLIMKYYLINFKRWV